MSVFSISRPFLISPPLLHLNITHTHQPSPAACALSHPPTLPSFLPPGTHECTRCRRRRRRRQTRVQAVSRPTPSIIVCPAAAATTLGQSHTRACFLPTDPLYHRISRNAKGKPYHQIQHRTGTSGDFRDKR
jgi:hypothetical protein